jgi:chaperone modulatory protein CbpM
MPPSEGSALTGTIVEEYEILSASELGRLCTVETHRIVELVEEGILTVTAEAGGEWRFSGANLRRARIALRLQQDLEVNLAGVALALDLLDEIKELRRRLRVGR